MARTVKNFSSISIYTADYLTAGYKQAVTNLTEITAGGSADITARFMMLIKKSDLPSGVCIFKYKTGDASSIDDITTFSINNQTGCIYTYNNEEYIGCAQAFGVTQTTIVNAYVDINPTDYTDVLTDGIINLDSGLTIDLGTAFVISGRTTATTLYGKVAPATGYSFYDGVTTVSVSVNSGDEVKYSISDNSAIISPSIPTSLSSINISALTISNIVTISASGINNATISPETITKGEEVTLTLTANDGYVFSGDTPSIILYRSDTSDTTTYYFTVSTDQKTATYTISSTVTTNLNSVSVTANAELSPDVPTTSYKFVDIYAVSDENLQALAKVRYYTATSEGGQQLFDLGQYVVSLKRFYCTLPTTGTTQTIALGNVNTEVSADLISSDFISLDCGTVKIETTNNNENDYSNTISGIIPFVGEVNLDANKIMNRTIGLTYLISVISGELVATIKDVENDIVLYVFNGNISENVPYIMNNVLWETQGTFANQASVLYGYTPRFIVEYHENYNDNTYYEDNKRGVISAVASGLCEVNDVIIDDLSNINNDEYSLILSELASGVIFDVSN